MRRTIAVPAAFLAAAPAFAHGLHLAPVGSDDHGAMVAALTVLALLIAPAVARLVPSRR